MAGGSTGFYEVRPASSSCSFAFVGGLVRELPWTSVLQAFP